MNDKIPFGPYCDFALEMQDYGYYEYYFCSQGCNKGEFIDDPIYK